MNQAEISQEFQVVQQVEKVLKTKYLFLNLLKVFRPGLILDVGSMDGSDSIRFRRMSEESKIIAVEANPYHASRMRANHRLAELKIELTEQLVSTTVDMAKFYISKSSITAETGGNLGTSSSLMPLDVSEVAESIDVNTVRLDEIIADNVTSKELVALWIDVEGAGFDVLSSACGIKDQIAFVHIEVELHEFWRRQKLKQDVIKLAREMGLMALARSKNNDQQDLVMINKRLYREYKKKVVATLLLTKLLGAASSRLLEKL